MAGNLRINRPGEPEKPSPDAYFLKAGREPIELEKLTSLDPNLVDLYDSLAVIYVVIFIAGISEIFY